MVRRGHYIPQDEATAPRKRRLLSPERRWMCNANGGFHHSAGVALMV